MRNIPIQSYKQRDATFRACILLFEETSGIEASGKGIVIAQGGSALFFGYGGGATFLAAWYDADGRLLGTSSVTDNAKKTNRLIPVGEDAARYKLLYLDANSFVPLCTAWSSN